MNQKVREHIVEDGVFIPDVGIEYPSQPDEPYLHPEKIRDVDVEHNFPFIDKSFKARVRNAVVTGGIYSIVWLVSKILYGLKIEGRKNITRNKAMLKNGAMTVCNHVHRWDFCFILEAVRKGREWFPANAANLETKDDWYILGAGGIPIPKTIGALRGFYGAFDSLVQKKKWIHVFPESCRWDWYEPVRPFKIGAFKMAVKYNYPIVPLAISYCRRTGWRKLFCKKLPLVTIRIGEPIPVENTGGLSKGEFCAELREKAHNSICALAGIKENCWEAAGD